MSSPEQKSFPAIDLFKFIMAIFVVAIHTEPFINCTNKYICNFFNNIFQVAVPFFFLSTGFLLQKKNESNCYEDIFGKYIVKIIKLYLIWSIIYLPLAIIDYKAKSYSFIKGVIVYFKDFIFIGQHYNSWILWYLLSTIYACIFIRWLLKSGLTVKKITCIGFFFLLFANSIDLLFFYKDYTTDKGSVLGIYSLLFGRQGRLFRSFFYIPMGMYITTWKSVNMPLTMVIIIVLLCLFPFINKPLALFLIVFVSVLFFFLCVNIKTKINSNYFVSFRYFSTGIYFTHLWVWTICYYFIYGEKTYGFNIFFVTLTVSLFISWLFFLIKNHSEK